MLKQETLAALQMERQCLPYRGEGAAYDALFRDLSPVPADGWCPPGTPPSIAVHAAFDDERYNALRRSRREILKGRYTGDGLIGYVAREDLELYACLGKKALCPSPLQAHLLELLRREGPMSIGMMKEFTGLLVKELTPALHKLQAAFLVYEDQSDSGGDRGWYLFEEEFPQVDLGRYTKKEALMKVVPRFARRNVFFDEEMVHSFYRLPKKEIQSALTELLNQGILQAAQLEERSGYLLAEDFAVLEDSTCPPPPDVLLIQRNDFLVRSNKHWLEKQFPPYGKFEVLYYLLIDGQLRGAVIGRFKFGPHHVERILTDLPPEEERRRREEILAAAAKVLNPAVSPVLHYGREG